MYWFEQGLCFLPVFLVVWSSATFIISYIIAVCKHDVDVLFPYISDTGDTPPESCIFGLMTFVSACAGIATIYAMYKYVEKLSEDTGTVKPCLNRAALVLGIISCFGMLIVATFQESAVEKVHLTGALLFFLCGALYINLQSYISYRSYPYGSSLCVCRTRLSVGIMAALTFFPTVICKFLDKVSSSNSYFIQSIAKSVLYVIIYDMPPTDPHLQRASAVCEWIVAFSFVCYFFTYIDDFKHFTLKVKTVCED